MLYYCEKHVRRLPEGRAECLGCPIALLYAMEAVKSCMYLVSMQLDQDDDDDQDDE